MNKSTIFLQTKLGSFLPPAQGILQRKCACGNHTVAGGECVECAKNKSGLQRKLAIGASNDPLEQEADRIADQVLSTPIRPHISKQQPQIRRYSQQATGDAGTAPASVDRVLASSGRPLEPVLRHDMEQRFGHDFSRVRVHSGAVAEQSARDVNANAYTVGHSIVFGTDQFAPAMHEGRRLIAHELAHVVQQSKRIGSSGSIEDRSSASEAEHRAGNLLSTPIKDFGSSEITLARQATYTKDISKLDDVALSAESASLSVWLGEHISDEPNYSTKLQAAVDVFIEISTRAGSPATEADIEALKTRLVASSPRTTFELRVRSGELSEYKPIYEKGEAVGYSRSSAGYSEIRDLEGKIVWSDEIPLETPLIDPIDLVPFELIGSLTAKAATIGLRAIAKAGVKILAKDVGKVAVEEGVKLGGKEVAGEVGKVGASKLPGAVAKDATGSVAKAAVGDASKSSIHALVEVFRKGEKLKSVGAVSLKRLRNVLGRAGVSPSKYKLVKVSKQVAETMEKEVGESIFGWVQLAGTEVVKDAKGRPIINFTPRALASLEEAVKTFGHEAKHLKDFAAGLATSSEALAEKEGEKLWLVVLESLEGK
jgi:hypothetical protein